jgi:hypothetical protein
MRSAAQNGNKPEVAPPPVLPGVKGPSEAAAPSASPADMSPNEALFDAINRGDLASARAAVNRGANLDSRNVLGLTPLDLSVDLGRNDISFMLMSMRGEDADIRQEARAGTGVGGGPRPDADRRTLFTASRVASRTRGAAAPSDAADDPPAAPAPRLYSGNGGTPIPNAGFVGFNAGR